MGMGVNVIKKVIGSLNVSEDIQWVIPSGHKRFSVCV